MPNVLEGITALNVSLQAAGRTVLTFESNNHKSSPGYEANNNRFGIIAWLKKTASNCPKLKSKSICPRNWL